MSDKDFKKKQKDMTELNSDGNEGDNLIMAAKAIKVII